MDVMYDNFDLTSVVTMNSQSDVTMVRFQMCSIMAP
jgi:hypothetical protein